MSPRAQSICTPTQDAGTIVVTEREAHALALQRAATESRCVSAPVRRGGCATPSVLVLGDEVLHMREIPACSTDLDGRNACVDLTDLAIFSGAFLSAPNTHPELDFDGSGGPLGLGDLVRLSGDFMRGTKGTYCP
jgi:hypothetical protein